MEMAAMLIVNMRFGFVRMIVMAMIVIVMPMAMVMSLLAAQLARQRAAFAPDQPGAQQRDGAIAGQLTRLATSFMRADVALSATASTATISTATTACNAAAMNEIAIPRRSELSLANM